METLFCDVLVVSCIRTCGSSIRPETVMGPSHKHRHGYFMYTGHPDFHMIFLLHCNFGREEINRDAKMHTLSVCVSVRRKWEIVEWTCTSFVWGTRTRPCLPLTVYTALIITVMMMIIMLLFIDLFSHLSFQVSKRKMEIPL